MKDAKHIPQHPGQQFGWKWTASTLLCALPILLVFAHFGSLGRGRAAALCFAVDFVAVKLRWEARQNRQFWVALGLALILQSLVIAFVPWGNQSMPGFTLLPLAIVIYVCDEGLFLLFCKKFINSSPK